MRWLVLANALAASLTKVLVAHTLPATRSASQPTWLLRISSGWCAVIELLRYACSCWRNASHCPPSSVVHTAASSLLCKNDIMEELGTQVWIGCLIAKHGPPKFQLLWKHLQMVLKHHLFDADPSEADCQRANRAMDQYCETIEELVQSGHVRFCFALC